MRVLVLGIAVGLAGCSGQSARGPAQRTEGREAMAAITIRSQAFDPGGAIPKKYTGEGEDVSPPLTWENVPPQAKELVLICDDPDAPRAEPWVHWVVYKIPASSTGLPEGSAAGAREGKNDFGRIGYGGPMPPRGHGVHHYHFKLYAVDTEVNLPRGATKDQVLKAIEGHIVGQGELIGTYERR